MMGTESIGNFEEEFEKEMNERKVREREGSLWPVLCIF